MSHDVIVVGLGAMGSAALYQLARRGLRCLGIDRFSPPHDRGSSHGETRITRQGVGEGEEYSELALRSHAIWRELEQATGERLLLECGFLAIDGGGAGSEFHGRKGFFDTTVASAERFGIHHELLSVDETARRFPQFCLSGHERVYFEPRGGLVFPERCIAAQLRRAAELGAEILTDTVVTAIEPDGDGVAMRTADGVHRAARAVLSAGGWTPGLAGAALSSARLLRQVLHWFPTDRPALYAAAHCPTYIWAHGQRSEDSFYGFPIVPGLTAGVKVATEQYADAIPAPEDLRRSVSPDEVAAMYDEHVVRRLAGLAPSALRSTVCLYTQTHDTHFVVDRDAASDRILLVSACSGHGFKHSAALGEAIAAQLAGGTALPGRFALPRKAPTSHPSI